MIRPLWLNRALLATTILAAPAIAYAQDEDAGGTASEGAQETGQDTAPPDVSAPGAVDISAPGEIIVTGRLIRDPTRGSSQVLSVLSTEDIARTGEGDIAGALGRVTGLSIVGDGYVYVRGLGDRYSLALLNGLPLPSPEPLKRVVPLDLFPTSVVASSLVQKSYSANYPGEFGGGVINLTTIAVPDESTLSIGGSVGANTETTFHFGYSYYGSGTDWSGFDNGTRDVPPALADYFASGLRLGEIEDDNPIITQLVHPRFAVVQKLGTIPADFSGTITGGTSFDVGDARIGIVASASYSNEWETRDAIRQSPALADLSVLDKDFRSVTTQNNITTNALLGVGAEFGAHRLRWTNLFIRDTVKEARLTTGFNVDNNNSSLIQDTAWFERQLIDTQLVGEFRFGDFGVDLRGGYAKSQRESPFETNFEYIRSDRANDPLGEFFINRLDGGSQGSATVAFSDLEEDLWHGGADISGRLFDALTATVGYSYTDTQRVSSRREFSIRAPASMPREIGLLRPDFLVQDANVRHWDFRLIETTQSDPAFSAGLEIHAGYGKFNWEPLDTISIDVGARFEKATQTVDLVQVFNEQQGNFLGILREEENWMPGATITWEALPDVQFRLSGSQTIARPQFRELIPQLYYDPATNRQYRGNEKLVDSTLTNAEARVEYYFAGEERVSVAGFWKEIDKPIETSLTFEDNYTLGSFANAPKATLYGGEFELVKYFDLDRFGGMFQTRRFVAIANYTYSKSELKVGPDDMIDVFFSEVPIPATFIFGDGEPLTGQSDHVANLQIGLENLDRLSQQTILLNYASERVVARGDGQLPDLVERPGITLDFVWREGLTLFGLDMEWKFEARNLLGVNHEEFMATQEARIDLNTYDIGTTFSLGASAKF